MAVLTFPAPGSSNWNTTYEPILQGHEDRIAAAETTLAAGGGGGAGATGAKLGRVFIDDYAQPNDNDDLRLTAALAAANVTYPPTITLGNRAHSFATANRPLREALRIQGPWGFSAPERSGQTKMASRINLSMTGGWFQMTGATNLFSISFGNLSLVGGSNARLLDWGTSTAVMYFGEIHDISSSGLRNVLGSYSTKMIVTAVDFRGAWEINNSFDTAIHLGGSDCVYHSFNGMIIDSTPGLNASGAATGHPHVWFEFFEKSNVGAIYGTAEGPWGGVVMVSGDDMNTTGSNMGGALNFFGGIWEGRNGTQPCQGSLYRQDGGLARLHGVTMNYGMSNPSAQGHTPTDAGMAHVYGNGRCYLKGTTYDRTTAVAETVPLAYCASDSLLTIDGTETESKNVTWTGKPRAQEQSADRITHDETVWCY